MIIKKNCKNIRLLFLDAFGWTKKCIFICGLFFWTQLKFGIYWHMSQNIFTSKLNPSLGFAFWLLCWGFGFLLALWQLHPAFTKDYHCKMLEWCRFFPWCVSSLLQRKVPWILFLHSISLLISDRDWLLSHCRRDISLNPSMRTFYEDLVLLQVVRITFRTLLVKEIITVHYFEYFNFASFVFYNYS